MKKALLLFSFLFFLFSFTAGKHPYHVGSVEINYNQKSGTFEVTGRFFLDDLENGLNKKYGNALHFNDPAYKARLNEALKNYSAEYFKLKTNNKFLKVNFVGYEEDHESVNIYLESESVTNPKKVEAAVSFLYNLFDDQINIVHIIVGGLRKSEKLTYPNRYLYQQF
ncbi:MULTISPECIES: DUF6702 family protein [Chryseobacterium]|uniref:Uncharacterized protein n=1 Tax=Chryseobacterium camelliae TaxID=1265445 RepID=A0ABU0TKJ3_9FLAO|nr:MULTISPECIES: DUF6702 family protein [Chryseobacterium]MDT3408588.1 hypothetical protein [Pseudacidovorax intermedius]MDQ1097557.1 hypothetical protein [Chryseobacterium camelliae]MDQ1101486.1 hypothetical protein [Chryseobacterium sp. SORGH_AS_1048]MDR6084929.1 hypothetical protein [Chryseobacterium sp. SORGH_AS_0909]MDR6129282.1 hypothetical protein [Chryseobacterium sp. SORGH_AS_1175]